MLSREEFRYKLVINGYSINEDYYYALNGLVKLKHNGNFEEFISCLEKLNLFEYIRHYKIREIKNPNCINALQVYDYLSQKDNDMTLVVTGEDCEVEKYPGLLIDSIESDNLCDYIQIKEIRKGCIIIVICYSIKASYNIYKIIKTIFEIKNSIEKGEKTFSIDNAERVFTIVSSLIKIVNANPLNVGIGLKRPLDNKIKEISKEMLQKILDRISDYLSKKYS